MSGREALQRCPSLVALPPRPDAYREASAALHRVLARYSDRIDPVSLDEAYLDVSDLDPAAVNPPDPTAAPARAIGEALRRDVYRATGLTASVGVSTSKLVAKIASDHQKPDGLTVVPPREVVAFLAPLPLSAFPGIGPKSAARLAELGLSTAADVQELLPNELRALVGRHAPWLERLASGVDTREVGRERVRKSIGAERTHASPLRSPAAQDAALVTVANEVAQRMDARGVAACRVTVKVKGPTLVVQSRQTLCGVAARSVDDLLAVARPLLSALRADIPRMRLVGLVARDLVPAHAPTGRQLGFAFG